MGIVKGLKAMEQVIDKPRAAAADGPKVRWLKLEDGQSVKVRFVNELDEDSPNYSPERDLAIVVSEHTNPKDYRRKAVCTMEEEGRCFGCEMYSKDPKSGWKARLRFYINLLVDDSIDEPYVAVWSQGVGKQSAFNSIREYVIETGSVSNLSWKLKRQGTGTDTTYVLLPTAPDAEPFDWTPVTPYPLERAVLEVTYADQEAFYLGHDTGVEVGASATNMEW